LEPESLKLSRKTGHKLNQLGSPHAFHRGSVMSLGDAMLHKRRHKFCNRRGKKKKAFLGHSSGAGRRMGLGFFLHEKTGDVPASFPPHAAHVIFCLFLHLRTSSIIFFCPGDRYMRASRKEDNPHLALLFSHLATTSGP